MINPLKGETPLTIGEGEDRRDFVLVLNHMALIAAEGAYGKPLAQTMAESTLGFVGAMGAMLFGALRSRHPEIGYDAACELMLEHGDAIAPVLATAAEAAFPKRTEGKEGENPPAQRPAGTSSGASGAKRVSTRKRSSTRPRAKSKSQSAQG